MRCRCRHLRVSPRNGTEGARSRSDQHTVPVRPAQGYVPVTARREWSSRVHLEQVPNSSEFNTACYNRTEPRRLPPESPPQSAAEPAHRLRFIPTSSGRENCRSIENTESQDMCVLSREAHSVWTADKARTKTGSKLLVPPTELIYKVPLVLGTKSSVQYILQQTPALQLVPAHLCTLCRRN